MGRIRQSTTASSRGLQPKRNARAVRGAVGLGRSASVTQKVVLSGNRSFKVELIPKGNATGQADGRSQQIATNIATGGECTTTIETTGLRTSSGSGEASLRKLSSATGKLALSFRGPSEQGRSSTSGRATYSNSKCGSNQTLPESAQPTDPNLQGEPPVVRVHVDWELVFGGGT